MTAVIEQAAPRRVLRNEIRVAGDKVLLATQCADGGTTVIVRRDTFPPDPDWGLILSGISTEIAEAHREQCSHCQAFDRFEVVA